MKRKFKEYANVDLYYLPDNKFYYFDRYRLNILSNMLSYICTEYTNLIFISQEDAFVDKSNFKLNEELENMIVEVVKDNHDGKIRKYDYETNSNIVVANELTNELFELRTSLIKTHVSLYFMIKRLGDGSNLDEIYEEIISKHMFENSVVRNTIYNNIINIIQNNYENHKYKNIDIEEFKKYFFNSKNFSKVVAPMLILHRSFDMTYNPIFKNILFEYIENRHSMDRIKNFNAVDNKVKKCLNKAIMTVANDKGMNDIKYEKFRHEINQVFYRLFPENKFRWCLDEVLTYKRTRPKYECEYILEQLMKNKRYTSDKPITVYHGITFNTTKYNSLEEYLDSHTGIKSLTDSMHIAFDFANRGDSNMYKPYVLEVKINPGSKHAILYKLIEDLYKEDPSTYYHFYKNFHYEKEILADLNDHEFRIMEDSSINEILECVS